MTDYAITLKKRKSNKLAGKVRAEKIKHYEGNNNNWFVFVDLAKSATAFANNDTITITLG